ncbi:MAG: trypsin-like serine protease [Myxococcales bacterium]|nr:trypsin-like serine protease [Myxococcales bacterium]
MRARLAARLALVGLAPLVLGASRAEVRPRVIGGQDSPPARDAAVLLVTDDPALSGRACTAVMLAPRLALTARHCVSRSDPSAECLSDGTARSGGAPGPDLSAGSLFVVSGALLPDLSALSRSAPRGVAILHEGAASLCDADVALVVLDRDVVDATLAPVRLDRATAPGEPMIVVGWGATADASLPRVRQERSAAVTRVGPAPAPELALGPRELEVGEGPCVGDSGGPLLAASSGAVVGVLSRGGRPPSDDDPRGCRDAKNVYASISSRAELLRAAYTRAGAELWLEGTPRPEARGDEIAGGCAAR